MNCEDVQKKISLLCGNDLPSEQNRQALLDHIDACESCSAELMELEESMEVFERVREEGESDAFWDTFQNDLDQRLSDLPSPAERRTGATAGDDSGHRTSSRFTSGMIAAAIFLIGIGLGYFGKPLMERTRIERNTPEESTSAPDDPSGSTVQQETDALEESRNYRTIDSTPYLQEREQQMQSRTEPIYQTDPVYPNPLDEVRRPYEEDVRTAED